MQIQKQTQKVVAAAELVVHTRAPMSGYGGGGGVCSGYKHSLVKTAWRQLAEHRDHLVSLRKASSLQTEYRREAQKRAAAEARYAQARSEREQLEGIEIIKDGGAALTAYGRLMFEDMPLEHRRAIEQGLKEYCELDTLAMVFLYQGLRDLLGDL